MTWATKLELMLTVGLRVPTLFLMDSVLNKNCLSFVFPYDPRMTWNQYFVWLFIMSFFFVFALSMFFLSVRHLLELYSYLVNVVALALSFWWNDSFVKKILNLEEDVLYTSREKSFQEVLEYENSDVYTNILAQFGLAWFFYMAWTFRMASEGYDNFMKSLVQTGMHISFILPILIRALLKDKILFQFTPVLAILYPMLQISNDFFHSLTSLVFFARRSFNMIKITISALGIQAFAETQWIRLHVPQVLRVFCIARTLYQISLYLTPAVYSKPPQLNTTDDTENVTLIVQSLLVRSCETFVSLLGTTSVVSFIAHYVGIFMAFCVGSNTEEDKNMGTVSAILFFILALQTGLTGLDPEKRLVRLYRNFALLSTAILHFVHSMVNPLLLSLSASGSTSVQKHIRVLGMCLFLVGFPSCLVWYLWLHHSASPWLLAVTAFSIEVVMKVAVSLTVYVLFIVDSYRETFWEKLDDYVYYIQSTGNTIEFLFGIFLFCNGGWIMMFESGGAIRAVMMCIHAYFNIWVQAKEGWKVFIKRRTAVNKINLLREATGDDLRTVNDVCAICYQELKTAKITACNHYYHSVCLRKWLYVQDNCPVCHKVVFKAATENGQTPPQDTQQNMDVANQNRNNIDHPEER